jgi:hypothetical protein
MRLTSVGSCAACGAINPLSARHADPDLRFGKQHRRAANLLEQ